MEMQYFKDYSPALAATWSAKFTATQAPDAVHPLSGWPLLRF